MEFRLLGQLEVRTDGAPVELGPFRRRSLLALLLIHRGQVLSTDQIMDSLWGEEVAASKQNALWVHMSNLRSALEPDRQKRSEGSYLHTRPPGYTLDVDGALVDIDEFERTAAEAELLVSTDPGAASVAFGEALALWRGKALEDFTYEPFAEGEIRRLEELRLYVVEQRIDADLSRGMAAELLGELEGLVRANPIREQFTGQLMTAFNRAGRRADAELAYQRLTRSLDDELGLDPSPVLQHLHDNLSSDVDLDLSRSPIASDTTLAVRGYELRELVDQNDLYVTHTAFQPAVGREVVVRRIRADRADQPDFIRRFESQATTVAALEHPHVLPLYDFWREPGAAYVVTRRVHGHTLADRLIEGRLEGADADRLVEQIGGALQAAHRHHIGHNNVRPESVVIDDEGNFFLDDFRLSNGKSSDDVISDDDAAFAALIESCTDLGSSTATMPNPRDVRNPYKGLRAFTQIDAIDFFGRERLVERLVSRLGSIGASGRFTVVVGPSGSGKSSVVKAGLLPALRHGAVAGSSDWFITEMTPGRHPFEQLADAIESVADASTSSLYGRLSGNDAGICDAIDSFLPDDASRLVLLIDQFEELYVQVDDHTRNRFIEGLVHAIDHQAGRLVVVATMRADFYDRPLQHQRLGELFRLGTEVVTPMTTDELARAVSEPATAAGVLLEPSLVASVVADVSDQPAALPLLQFALTELFDGRTNGTITLAAYNELGGVAGALVTRADQVVALLPKDARDTVKQVLLRLVHVGSTAREDTRRIVLVSELESLGSPRQVALVLEAFGRHRLLTFDRDPISRTPTVEIAHEALLREWGLFRNLVEDNRDGIRLLHTLSTTAALWEESRDPSELFRGTRLDSTLHWIAKSGTQLSPVEKEFVAESEQTRQDLLDIERERVEQRDRQNRRLRRLLVAMAGVALAATVLGLFALQQQRRAEDEQFVGETRRLAADGPGVVETNRRVGLLLAAEAYRRDPNPNTLGALQKVLIKTKGLLGYVGSGVAYNSAVWSGDGTLIIGVRTDGIDIFDAQTFAALGTVDVADTGPTASGPGALFAVTSQSRSIEIVDLRRAVVTQSLGHDEQVISLAIDPAASIVAVGDAAGELRLVQLAGGEELWRTSAHPEQEFDLSSYPAGVEAPGAHEPASFALGVRGIDFADDGATLGTTGSGFIRTWDVIDGAKRHEVPVFRRSFNRDENVFGSPEEIELIDGDAGAITHTSRYIQKWDLEARTVEENSVVLSDAAPASADLLTVAAAFGSEFGIVVEVDQAQMVDLSTGQRPQAFNLQAGSLNANIAVSPDDNTLLSAGADGIVVWALDGRELLGRSIESSREVRGGLTISNDGNLLAVEGSSDPVRGLAETRLWSIGGTPAPLPLEPGTRRVILNVPNVAILQDENANLSARSIDDLDTELGFLGSINNYVGTLSLDGRTLVFGTGAPDEALLHIFDTETFAPLRPPIDTFAQLGAQEVAGLSFSPDGSRLAAATLEGVARVFDTETWQPIDPPLGSGAGFVVAVAYSSDGRFLATSDSTGKIVLRDPETFQPIGNPLVGSTAGGRLAATQSMAFTPDGRYLLSTIDGSGRLFDVDARLQIGGGFPSAVGINTSPTSAADRLAVARGDQIMIYDLDIDSWFDIACRAAGRNFTIDEWHQFGAEGSPAPRTCPQWPTPTEEAG